MASAVEEIQRTAKREFQRIIVVERGEGGSGVLMEGFGRSVEANFRPSPA